MQLSEGLAHLQGWVGLWWDETDNDRVGRKAGCIRWEAQSGRPTHDGHVQGLDQADGDARTACPEVRPLGALLWINTHQLVEQARNVRGGCGGGGAATPDQAAHLLLMRGLEEPALWIR